MMDPCVEDHCASDRPAFFGCRPSDFRLCIYFIRESAKSPLFWRLRPASKPAVEAHDGLGPSGPACGSAVCCWRNCRVPPTSAFWCTPPFHGTDLEEQLRVVSDPTFFEPATSPSGGYRAYVGRLGKDRSPGDSRHSVASTTLHRPFATSRLELDFDH